MPEVTELEWDNAKIQTQTDWQYVYVLPLCLCLCLSPPCHI